MFRFFALTALVCGIAAAELTFPIKAVADTQSGDGLVTGGIQFVQLLANRPVTLSMKFSGLKPGLHGFHIHENAVRNNDCLTAGGHLNLNGNTHHGKSSILLRHLGDLGNVIADDNGEINLFIDDQLIQLHGPSSNVGRSFVLHAKRDDLGLGGDDESKKTGNAGGRIACGTITLLKDQ